MNVPQLLCAWDGDGVGAYSQRQAVTCCHLPYCKDAGVQGLLIGPSHLHCYQLLLRQCTPALPFRSSVLIQLLLHAPGMLRHQCVKNAALLSPDFPLITDVCKTALARRTWVVLHVRPRLSSERLGEFALFVSDMLHGRFHMPAATTSAP